MLRPSDMNTRNTLLRTTAGLLTLAAAVTSVATVLPAAGAQRVPQRTNADLTASVRGGDAAMSHTYGRIVLTNTSRHACFVRGYGGLSYVGGGDVPDRRRGRP